MKQRTVKTVEDAIGELTEARDKAALKAKKDGFDQLTPEERSAISGYAQAVEPLNEELVALRAAEEAIARTAKVNGGAREGLSEAEARDFKKLSIVRGLQLLAENKPLDGIEAEVHQIAQREASKNGVALEGFGVPAFIGNERGQTVTGQTTTAGDQGGVTVETEVNGLLSALWESSFLSQVGARRLAGLQGNPRFIVEATNNTPQELTETQEMTEDEILMSEFTMLPTRRGTAIPVSKQTLLQASIDVQKLVQDNITKGLDRKLNQDAVTALLAAIISGNNNLLALGTNGADPTYAHMVALETLVSNANAIGARNAYLLNTKTKGKLALTQKFSGTNGAPVYGDDNTVYGYPAVVSNLVPSNLTKGTSTSVCSAGIFGNFDDLYVGMWGGMDFVVDTLTQAKKGNVLVVANMYWQVKVARAASFSGFKDATTVIS